MDDPDCDRTLLDATYARFGTVNRLVSGWRGSTARASAAAAARRAVRCSTSAPEAATSPAPSPAGPARTASAWRSPPSIRTSAPPPSPRRRPAPPGVSSAAPSSADLVAEGERFDLVTSNHLLHHLSPASLADLLADSERLAPRPPQRHRALAAGLPGLLRRLPTLRSPLVHLHRLGACRSGGAIGRRATLGPRR